MAAEQQRGQSRKQEIAELAGQLYLAKDRNPEVQTMLRLLVLLCEDAKDDLLVARPDQFQPIQGEANAYKSLHRLILTKPLTAEQRRGGA